MSEPNEVEQRTDDGRAASGSAVEAPATSKGTAASAPAPSSADAGPSQAVLGPFTARELVFGGGVVLMFIGTLLPFVGGRVLYTTFWSSESLFFIGIGILLPVIAVALLAGRRLGSSGLRVGSLSVDQFASVTAVLAATFFFLQTVTGFQFGALLALVGSLGLLAATVAAPLLPVLKDDFTDRPDIVAHPMARPITAAKPRPPKPAKPAADAVTTPDSGAASTTSSSDTVPAPGKAGVFSRGKRDGGTVAALPSDGPVAGRSVGTATRVASTSGGAVGAVGAAGAAAPSGPDTSQGSSAISSGGSSSAPSGRGSDAPAPVTGSAVTAGSGTTPQQTSPVDDAPSSSRAPVEETRIHEAVRPDASTGGSGVERARQEPITATRSADEEQVVEAFWFAVGSPRPVFDENTGREIFVLQPGDWEVGIEDRGRDFLVQDKRSGAVGILRDLRNIERAPRD